MYPTGFITFEDFRQTLKLLSAYLKMEISDEAINELVINTDTNNDGSIDIDEFMEAFRLVDKSRLERGRSLLKLRQENQDLPQDEQTEESASSQIVGSPDLKTTDSSNPQKTDSSGPPIADASDIQIVDGPGSQTADSSLAQTATSQDAKIAESSDSPGIQTESSQTGLQT